MKSIRRTRRSPCCLTEKNSSWGMNENLLQEKTLKFVRLMGINDFLANRNGKVSIVSSTRMIFSLMTSLLLQQRFRNLKWIIFVQRGWKISSILSESDSWEVINERISHSETNFLKRSNKKKSADPGIFDFCSIIDFFFLQALITGKGNQGGDSFHSSFSWLPIISFLVQPSSSF